MGDYGLRFSDIINKEIRQMPKSGSAIDQNEALTPQACQGIAL
jgi:hypothetical protein